ADREEVDERVGLPPPPARAVGPPTPQVDDRPAAHRDGNRRTDLAPLDEVRDEGVTDGGEAAVRDALDGRPGHSLAMIRSPKSCKPARRPSWSNAGGGMVRRATPRSW